MISTLLHLTSFVITVITMCQPNRHPGSTGRTVVRWQRMVVLYRTAWPRRYNILFNLFLGAVFAHCRWSHSTWHIPICDCGELISYDNKLSLTCRSKWLWRFYTFIDHKRRQHGTPKLLTAEQAATIIMSSSYQPLDIVGFDSVDASRINVKKGDNVSITPTDTGKQIFNGHASISLWHFDVQAHSIQQPANF